MAASDYITAKLQEIRKMKLTDLVDGRRKPRFSLTRSERQNAEMVRAFRRARRIMAVPTSGLTGPEAAARIDRVLTVGLRTYLNPKPVDA